MRNSFYSNDQRLIPGGKRETERDGERRKDVEKRWGEQWRKRKKEGERDGDRDRDSERKREEDHYNKLIPPPRAAFLIHLFPFAVA